jgi:methionine-rich copper-binding protein CopC
MRVVHDLRGRRAGLFATAISLVALASPAAVWAHAMLESAAPAVGSTVETPPPVVSATFDDDLVASKSSIEVVGPDGATIAKGGVLADDPKTLSVEVPLLAPATYDVRWAAASEDGHLERGRYQFAVAAAASPGPSTTAGSSATTSGGAAIPSSAYAPPGTAQPSASPVPGDASGGSESAGQILVIAAVGLVLGLGVGWWRSRRSG